MKYSCDFKGVLWVFFSYIFFFLTIEMDKQICIFGMFGAEVAVFMTKMLGFTREMLVYEK